MSLDDRKKLGKKQEAISSSSEHGKVHKAMERKEHAKKEEKQAQLARLKLQMDLQKKQADQKAKSKPEQEKDRQTTEAMDQPGSADELAEKEQVRLRQQEIIQKQVGGTEQQTEGAG